MSMPFLGLSSLEYIVWKILLSPYPVVGRAIRSIAVLTMMLPNSADPALEALHSMVQCGVLLLPLLLHCATPRVLP